MSTRNTALLEPWQLNSSDGLSDAELSDELRQALVDLAPSWLTRSGPYQETIVAPANDISRHIIPRWPNEVGPAGSLVLVSNDIQNNARSLALAADQHIGLVLSDSSSRIVPAPPFLGYDLRQGKLLHANDEWQLEKPSHLLVDAAVLDDQEQEEFLRLKEQEKETPLAEEILDELARELVQWQKDLAYMKASIQASLMQGGDPLALGDLLKSLSSLIAQGRVLASVTGLARNQPKDKQHHTEVRKHAEIFRNKLEAMVRNPQLPRDIVAKLHRMLSRLQKIMDKPSLAQAFFTKAIQAKIALGKTLNLTGIVANKVTSSLSANLKGLMKAAFRNAATATVIRFPISPLAQQRLAAIAARRAETTATDKSAPQNSVAKSVSASNLRHSSAPVTSIMRGSLVTVATGALTQTVFAATPASVSISNSSATIAPTAAPVNVSNSAFTSAVDAQPVIQSKSIESVPAQQAQMAQPQVIAAQEQQPLMHVVNEQKPIALQPADTKPEVIVTPITPPISPIAPQPIELRQPVTPETKSPPEAPPIRSDAGLPPREKPTETTPQTAPQAASQPTNGGEPVGGEITSPREKFAAPNKDSPIDEAVKSFSTSVAKAIDNAGNIGLTISQTFREAAKEATNFASAATAALSDASQKMGSAIVTKFQDAMKSLCTGNGCAFCKGGFINNVGEKIASVLGLRANPIERFLGKASPISKLNA